MCVCVCVCVCVWMLGSVRMDGGQRSTVPQRTHSPHVHSSHIHKRGSTHTHTSPMQNRCPIQAGHLIGSLCPTGPPHSPVPTVATSKEYEIIPEAKDSLLIGPHKRPTYCSRTVYGSVSSIICTLVLFKIFKDKQRSNTCTEMLSIQCL